MVNGSRIMRHAEYFKPPPPKAPILKKGLGSKGTPLHAGAYNVHDVVVRIVEAKERRSSSCAGGKASWTAMRKMFLSISLLLFKFFFETDPKTNLLVWDGGSSVE